MYVRWKRRPLRRRRIDRSPDWAQSAVLVESRRIDGKPRQRVVRYLGSIREGMLEAIAWQAAFWRDVEWHLDDLGLDEATRRSVVATLLRTVPRPDEAAVQRNAEVLGAQLAAIDRTLPSIWR